MQVEAAGADIERRQAELQRAEAAAAAAAEELRARERALKRQEDGLEGLKVRLACLLGSSECDWHVAGS